MAKKIKNMLRSKLAVCVMVLVAVGLVSVVFAADVKVKSGTVHIENDTYLKAVDNAGTGTVDLIKANSSDVAVIPDGSELATSAAPTADADIANKKYVDEGDTVQHDSEGGYSNCDVDGTKTKVYTKYLTGTFPPLYTWKNIAHGITDYNNIGSLK